MTARMHGSSAAFADVTTEGRRARPTPVVLAGCRGRFAVALATLAATLAGAGTAHAQTRTGPTVFPKPTSWSDCGDGFGGSERVSTVAAGATTGYALHEHRYCPTRPVTVSYYFYAYDQSDRNICALADNRCDESLPFDAFAVASVTFGPGDFAPGGFCSAAGCPVTGALPEGNPTSIKNVIVEPVDDAGVYGVTHNVLWDPMPTPTPAPAPPAGAPSPGPVATVGDPQLPAQGEEPPVAPAPDMPATDGVVAGPSADAPPPLLRRFGTFGSPTR
jgi:hypothetical protein